MIVCEVTDARRLYLRDWPRPRDLFYRHAARLVTTDPVIEEWFAARGAIVFPRTEPLPEAPRRFTFTYNSDFTESADAHLHLRLALTIAHGGESGERDGKLSV